MNDDLRQDYRAMSDMIFGEPPPFDAIIEAISTLEQSLNSAASRRTFASISLVTNLTEIAQEILGSIPKCKGIILGVSMRVS